MKKILTIFLWFIFIGTSFAQQAQICSSSPDALNNYFSTIISTLNKIKKSKPKKKPTWLKALWAKLTQTVIWNAKLFTIFSLDWFSKNFFASFKILTHENYIVRDWVKLINFKSYISKAFSDFSQKWILEEKIPEETLNQLKNAIKSNYYFLHDLPNNATYEDFFKFIRDNQIDIESLYFLAVTNKTNTSSLTTRYPTIQKHIWDFFSSIRKKYLDKSYKEYKCSMDIQKTIEKIKEIIDLSKRSKNAIKRFQCNYQRLKAILQWNSPSTQCWNVKLVDKRQVWIKGKIQVQWAWKIILNAVTNSEWPIIDTSKFNPDFSLLFQKLWAIKKNIDTRNWLNYYRR